MEEYTLCAIVYVHEETVTVYNVVTNGTCVSSTIILSCIKLSDLDFQSHFFIYIFAVNSICTHQSLNLTGFAKPIPIGIITEIHFIIAKLKYYPDKVL